jgi:hypothetical protein
MKKKDEPSAVKKFFLTKSVHPLLVGLSTGLYPILFYFTTNLTLVNSWEHLVFFILIFLLIPMILFRVCQLLVKKHVFGAYGAYLIPFLSIFIFLFFIGICHYGGINKKASLLILFGSLALVYFLVKHLDKIIKVQLLLALIGLPSLIYAVANQPFYSKDWHLQPDDIEKVIFKTKPNVYLIQPDGYVNFSELKKGYYNIDNSLFEKFIDDLDFKNYPDFRSNYPSTLASNTSMLMMKHHYYNKAMHPSDGLHSREVIVTKNTVLDVFKNNGYKTHLVTEAPYLLLNRPKMGFDRSNFKRVEVPFIGKGFKNKKNVITPLKDYIEIDKEISKFFFVEFFNPGHITNSKYETTGFQNEKVKWLKALDAANNTLTEMITMINELDPEGLIIILSDHGGYVGLDYAMEMYAPIYERDKLYSIFGSNLSIKWPNNKAPDFDQQLKTTVNVFRILFSYLSQEKKYLNNLQADSSYSLIFHEAPTGPYESINEAGEVTFIKYDQGSSDRE